MAIPSVRGIPKYANDFQALIRRARHWSRVSPCLPSPNGGEPGVPRELPLGSAAPGEDRVPSPVKKSFHTSGNSNKSGVKRVIPREDIAPYGLQTPTLGAQLWLGAGVREPAVPGGDTVPSPDHESNGDYSRRTYSQHEPAPPGEERVPSPDQKSLHLQLQQTGDENGGGRYRPARCGNPNRAGCHNR